MHTSLALVALAFTAIVKVHAVPQAVTSSIAPASTAPAGCSANYIGSFQIATENVTSSKRDLEGRELAERQTTPLTISLRGGILTDSQGRTGYVAANQQFQFDGPPQAGAIYTAGFSVCSNGTLALGNTAIWYQCLSGDFYNLYYKSQGGQCSQAYLIAESVSGSGGPGPVTGASSSSGSSGSSTASMSSSSTMAANGTAGMMSSTMSASSNGTASMTASGSSSTMTGRHTGVGGMTTGHTTVRTTVVPSSSGGSGGSTGGAGGPTTGASGGGASSSSAAAASSASAGAASGGRAGGEVLGVVAGLLAFAMV